MSECCYSYIKQKKDTETKTETGQYLPYEVKELIVKYFGGIGVIMEIDNDLKNNNSTTDQQDDVINQAEAVNDVNLTTGGATANCSDGLF